MTSEFDDAQSEWNAQDGALHDEREHAAKTGNVRLLQYRLIARALRQPEFDPLPDSFVIETVARVEQAHAADRNFEYWLQFALCVFLGIAGAFTLSTDDTPFRALYAWFTTLEVQTSGWMLAIAMCFGLTLAVEFWQRKSV